MDALNAKHRRVFKTICDAGVIQKQDMSIVYGRLLNMPDGRRGEYLREVVLSSVRTEAMSKQARDEGVLRKKARRVVKINKDVHIILENMADVMYIKDGVGFAANQIGVLKRLVVADTGDGLIRLVNPVIIQSSGEQTGEEGCLSVPDVRGMVKRPAMVVVKAYDETGRRIEVKGEGLLARVLCHEIDHLDGILFIDRAEPGTLERSAQKKSGRS